MPHRSPRSTFELSEGGVVFCGPKNLIIEANQNGEPNLTTYTDSDRYTGFVDNQDFFDALQGEERGLVEAILNSPEAPTDGQLKFIFDLMEKARLRVQDLGEPLELDPGNHLVKHPTFTMLMNVSPSEKREDALTVKLRSNKEVPLIGQQRMWQRLHRMRTSGKSDAHRRIGSKVLEETEDLRDVDTCIQVFRKYNLTEEMLLLYDH